MARGAEVIALVLPARTTRVDRVAWEGPLAPGGISRGVDLDTGRVTRIGWRRTDGGPEFPAGLDCTVPTLIGFGPA